MVSLIKWVRYKVQGDLTEKNIRNLNKLPLEIYYKIFDEYLNIQDITNAQCSCKFFRDVGRSLLWSRLFIQHGMIPTGIFQNERLLSGLYSFVGSKDLIFLDEQELLFMPKKRCIVVRRDLDAFYMLLHAKKDEIIPLVQYARINIDGRRDQGDASVLDNIFIPMAQYLTTLELYISSAFGVNGRLNKLLFSLNIRQTSVKLCIHPLLPGPVDELPLSHPTDLNITAVKFIQWDERHNSYAVSSWEKDERTILYYIQRYLPELPSTTQRLVLDYRAFTFSDIMGVRLRLTRLPAERFTDYITQSCCYLAEVTLKNFDSFCGDNIWYIPESVTKLSLLNSNITKLNSSAVTQLSIAFTSMAIFRHFIADYTLPNLATLYCDTLALDTQNLTTTDTLKFPNLKEVYWRGGLDLLPLVGPNASTYVLCGKQANLELDNIIDQIPNVDTLFIQLNFFAPAVNFNRLKKLISGLPKLEALSVYVCKPTQDDLLQSNKLLNRYLQKVPEDEFDLPVAYKVNLRLLLSEDLA